MRISHACVFNFFAAAEVRRKELELKESELREKKEQEERIKKHEAEKKKEEEKQQQQQQEEASKAVAAGCVIALTLSTDATGARPTAALSARVFICP